MRRYLRLRKSVAGLATITALALAVTASSASATEWVQGTSGGIKWSGTSLTLKKNGGSAVTCTIPVGGITGTREAGGTAFLWNGIYPYITLKCSNGKNWQFVGAQYAEAETSAGVFDLRIADYSGVVRESPYGQYVQGEEAVGTFTNGAGATPSKLVFSEDKVSFELAGGGVITVSGTVNVSQSNGSLLTLKK